MRTILIGAAAVWAMASPAAALEVEAAVETTATPAAVWTRIGEFCEIARWHPAVEACSVKTEDGTQIRTLTLAGNGGTLVEQLVSRDEAAMRYTYRIVDGPLPVQGYESTISVKPDATGKGSQIGWRGTFEAKGASDEEASKVIRGIYDAGLAALAEPPAN